MSRTSYQWPALGRILPDVLAFALGLGAAWILGWKTTDLVWSLWLSSLVLGYLTILSTIGGAVYFGVHVICHKDFPRKYRLTGILVGTAAALMFLGFFSLHFCGFHAGHASFLSSFFPLHELPKNAFANAFMNPLLLWKTVFQHLLPAYGVFLVATIIAERTHIFAFFTGAVQAVQEGLHKQMLQNPMQVVIDRKTSLHDPLYRPYLNIWRMHILIFFFAFCHALKMESFFIYAVVYLVYFFPWKAFRANVPEPQTGATLVSSEQGVPE